MRILLLSPDYDVLCHSQMIRPCRWRVHEPGLDYEVESDEDWSEPEDGESLTVRAAD